MKTKELTGAALDWAVAKCEGRVIITFLGGGILVNGRTELGNELDIAQGFNYMWHPSTDWAQGGTIIEREKMTIAPVSERARDYDHAKPWSAYYRIRLFDDCEGDYCSGATPLIAAMRCYLVSKLGNEVEIPEELL